MGTNILPTKVFFVSGLGVHKHKLASFEAALRSAGIASFNLVYVSSILPPRCEVISSEDGLKLLKPGEIVYCVMARSETNEPSRLITAAVGVAVPNDSDRHGYISEHHGYGLTSEAAGEYAEDLAATMLATTLGIEFDPDVAWDERKQIYEASGQIIRTHAYSVAAEGDEYGRWTTAISAAVFIA
ncbi:MAG TPA: arginine decarboxylase, pyruvoyl-dependent [Candidatus Hydrogenedentes bacterium]|nr:arginine decarboxylase, pyruvoyl-dependent [Candidatus Hydrogenedentota bacterium]